MRVNGAAGTVVRLVIEGDDSPFVIEPLSVFSAPVIIRDAMLEWYDRINLGVWDNIASSRFCGARSLLFDRSGELIARGSKWTSNSIAAELSAVWVLRHHGHEIDFPKVYRRIGRGEDTASHIILVCPVRASNTEVFSVIVS